MSVKEKQPPNPWFDYRNAWTSREAAARSRERVWQIVTLMSCLVALFSLGGLVYYANSSRFIPYVVEVDKLGAAMGVKAADRMRPIDGRVVQYSIAQFIGQARIVSPDVSVQRKAIFQVFGMLNRMDVAFGKMSEFLNGNPEKTPFKRAETETVEIEIVSMIPQTESSWEVDWNEIIRDRATGRTKERIVMRANVSYYIAPVDLNQTQEGLMLNPLALFIRDFNWTRVQETAIRPEPAAVQEGAK